MVDTSLTPVPFFVLALLKQVDSLFFLIELFPDLTWTLGDLLPLIWWTHPI